MALLFCRLYQESLETFKGKRVIGLLVGYTQTSDTTNRLEMDDYLQARRMEKRFFQLYGSPDPCRPCQTSAATTPGALPRRVRQVASPMRRAVVQARPRMISKFGGVKLSSLI